MGLDIALGIVVLVAALRGYFKGFLRQAIHLAALVGCVYLADPVRDLARPYAADYLPAVDSEVLDRLLWWTAAVLSYVVTSGAAISLVRLAQRRGDPDEEVRRGDRGLGFLLGAAKGGLVALFVAWGLSSHAERYIEAGGWVGEQVRTSKVLKLSAEHRPAERIWESEPVQNLVARIRSRGFRGEVPEERSPSDPAGSPATSPVETAQPGRSSSSTPPDRVAVRPEPLQVPVNPPLDPASSDFLEEFDAALERFGIVPDRSCTPLQEQSRPHDGAVREGGKSD